MNEVLFVRMWKMTEAWQHEGMHRDANANYIFSERIAWWLWGREQEFIKVKWVEDPLLPALYWWAEIRDQTAWVNSTIPKCNKMIIWAEAMRDS